VNNLYTYGFLNLPLTVAASLDDYPGYFVTNQAAVNETDAVVYLYAIVGDELVFGTLVKPSPGTPFPYGFLTEPR